MKRKRQARYILAQRAVKKLLGNVTGNMRDGRTVLPKTIDGFLDYLDSYSRSAWRLGYEAGRRAKV